MVSITEYYLIASWYAWDQAASYGIRMLITIFLLAAVGIAYVIEKAVNKFSYKLVFFVGVILFIFNVVMIIRFYLSVKTATRDDAAQNKLNQVFHTHFAFFHE